MNKHDPVRELKLTAPDGGLENASLSITYEPANLKLISQRYWISHMDAGEQRSIAPGSPGEDLRGLRAITLRTPGKVRVELMAEDGATLSSQERPITWLPDNEYPGMEVFPEWVATAIYPADAAVEKLLQQISSSPEDNTWPGYSETKEAVKRRLYMLWDAVCHYTETHKLPRPQEAVPVKEGCTVRTPSQALELGYAHTLDIALLLASCVARINLNPLIIFAGTSVYIGVMLERLNLPSTIDCSVEEIEQKSKEEQMLIFNPVAMLTCLRAAAARIESIHDEKEKVSDENFLVVDVRQVWGTELFRLADGSKPSPAAACAAGAKASELSLSDAPKTRFDHWQRKLLDLSLRNGLINAKLRGKNRLRIIVPDISSLEDALASGASFRVKSLPEKLLSKPDDAQPSGVPEDVTKEAQNMLVEKLIAADADEGTVKLQLGGLYNAARREMEESGVNTLYIACAFLCWVPRGGPKDRILRAPLILLPVQLTRTSVRDGYVLRSSGDETQINRTLLEMLRSEYSLRMPELDGDLPRDEKGVDVARILQIVRHAIAGMEYWNVEEQSMIGLFSFAKFLMWQDMVARKDILLKNAVVQHLAAPDRGRFPAQVGFPDPAQLDSEVDADKIYTPLPSDSSQLAAVLAAARGKSFVLEGPPGTGKSQTIANMIAHCLGCGKTVLFVAEKAVALEVVHKRLSRIGLGNFCLQLHSNKTRPDTVVDQLRPSIASIADSSTRSTEWKYEVESMVHVRDSLNALPKALHTAYPDGSSLYDEIARSACDGDLPIAKLTEKDPLTLTGDQRRSIIACAHELATHFALIHGDIRLIAQDLLCPSYSDGWDKQLATVLESIKPVLQMREEILSEWAQVTDRIYTGEEADHALLTTTLEMTADHPGEDWSVLLPRYAPHTLDVLQRLAQHADSYRQIREALSLSYPDSAVDHPSLDARLAEWRNAERSNLFSRFWKRRSVAHFLRELSEEGGDPDVLNDLTKLISMRTEKESVPAGDTAILPRFLNRGMETSAEAEVRQARTLATRLAKLTDEQQERAIQFIDYAVHHAEELSTTRTLAAWKSNTQTLREQVHHLSELLHSPCQLIEHFATGEAQSWVKRMLESRGHWRDVTLWNKHVDPVRNSECAPLVDMLLCGTCPPEKIEAAAELNLGRYKLRAAETSVDSLYNFSPSLHEKRISNYGIEEASLRARTSEHLSSLLAEFAKKATKYDKEVAILQREMTKKRGYMPLRKLLQKTPHVIRGLKPCFLMSPLSIAQYLSPEEEPFDVVIFDEASQIPVWDAIGAIGRGTSVIITGDSRQMPPTSFFNRSQSDESEDEDLEQDMESILDECTACGVPRMYLTWHYRSKSEALIAFSNKHYYEGRMTTFPAPTLHDTALQFHSVRGVYEPGAKKRINEEEAKAVVAHVLQTLHSPGFRYTEATSIGVVTFNMQQQKLIEDLFEEARANDPTLEPYFAEDNPEAIFVKNLENVQGDERGVIYFSTTYARDAGGRMSMNFGPLNLTGGERRLNVAVTRARYAMHVFSSMQPEDIDLSRTRAQGAADLRAFLEYARNNSKLSASAPSAGKPDALALRISASLAEQGWQCHTNIGASDYRVDIAVEDPDHENAVLAGITLDGATYGSARTARDRDVTRPEAMTLLGWRLIHAWALDWWRHPDECVNTLNARLREFQKLGPVQQVELPSLLAADRASPKKQVEEKSENEEPSPDRKEVQPGETPLLCTPKKKYRDAFSLSQDKLQQLAVDIVLKEAPLTLDHLAQRIVQIAPPSLSSKSKKYTSEFGSFRDTQVEQSVRVLAKNGICLIRRLDAPYEGMREVLSLPNEPEVLPRSIGTRCLQNVPADELREIARLVQRQLACLPGSEAHIRGMAKFLALPRLSKDVRQLLQSITGVAEPEA